MSKRIHWEGVLIVLIVVGVIVNVFLFTSVELPSVSEEEVEVKTSTDTVSRDIEFNGNVEEVVLQSQRNKIERKIHRDLRRRISSSEPSSSTVVEPEEKITVVLQVSNEDEFSALSDRIRRGGGEVTDTFSVGDVMIAEIPAGAVEEVVSDDSVTSAWPNREYSVLLENSHSLLRTQTAWDLGYDGSGVTIAILDTGIAEHEMFGDRVVAEMDFSGSGSANDGHGHGTHIAGIAAGNGQYRGVAYGASLLNAKVLTDSGRGTTSSIVAGINWAVAHNADVISISIGGTYTDQDEPVINALEEAIDAGITVVVASGNCGQGCGTFNGVTTPGSAEAVITVGAVNDQMQLAPFSSHESFGRYSKPDVVSLGVGVLSSVVGGYSAKSGTSMATPFVAGVAALLKQVDPSIRHEEVKDILESSAQDLGPAGRDEEHGFGFVDIGNVFGVERNESEEVVVNSSPLVSIVPLAFVDSPHEYDEEYAQEYLAMMGHFSDVEFLALDVVDSVAFIMKVGNVMDNIHSYTVEGRNFAIHLLGCEDTGSCGFRINGVPTRRLVEGDVFTLDSEYELRIDAIDIDYCDGRLYCDLAFDAYDVVNVSIERRDLG